VITLSFFFSFFLLFCFLHQAETEHQSESNSVTPWTPSPWKASPCHAALRKDGAISTHCHCWHQTCMHKICRTSENHTSCGTSLPTHWDHKLVQPMGDWSCLPPQNWKTNSEL
jgi:hypothetical protein